MGDDPYRQLRTPGETNDALAEAIEDDGNLPRSDVPCELCRIPDYPFNIDETVLYRDEGGYVAATEDLKGHEVRNMAVIQEHGTIPDEEERQQYIDELKRVTAGQIQDGEMIVFGSMQTFSDHWHVVASDLDGDDLAEINDYDLYRVEDNSYKLEESVRRSTVGEEII